MGCGRCFDCDRRCEEERLETEAEGEWTERAGEGERERDAEEAELECAWCPCRPPSCCFRRACCLSCERPRQRPRIDESASEGESVALDVEERESERECLGAGGSDDGLGIRGAIRGPPPPSPLPLGFWF